MFRPWENPITRPVNPEGHAEILYEDVRVPFDNVVGGEAGIGQGFALAQKRLGPGRIHHAMRWLGQSSRAFDLLCERALTRYTKGSILADKQMIQDWVAQSYADRQAARLLTLQAAWKMDKLHEAGGTYSDARLEIAVIKFWGAKVLHDVIDRAIQIHGSLGYTTDLPLESIVPGGTSRPHLRRPQTRCTRSPSPDRCSSGTGQAIRRSIMSPPAEPTPSTRYGDYLDELAVNS